MAKPGRQTFEKRLRERKKKEKQQEKLERKAARKADKDPNAETDDVFDFDLEQIDIEQTLALPEDHPLRIAVQKKLAADELAANSKSDEADDDNESETAGESDPAKDAT